MLCWLTRGNRTQIFTAINSVPHTDMFFSAWKWFYRSKPKHFNGQSAFFANGVFPPQRECNGFWIDSWILCFFFCFCAPLFLFAKSSVLAQQNKFPYKNYISSFSVRVLNYLPFNYIMYQNNSNIICRAHVSHCPLCFYVVLLCSHTFSCSTLNWIPINGSVHHIAHVYATLDVEHYNDILYMGFDMSGPCFLCERFSLFVAADLGCQTKLMNINILLKMHESIWTWLELDYNSNKFAYTFLSTWIWFITFYWFGYILCQHVFSPFIHHHRLGFKCCINSMDETYWDIAFTLLSECSYMLKYFIWDTQKNKTRPIISKSECIYSWATLYHLQNASNFTVIQLKMSRKKNKEENWEKSRIKSEMKLLGLQLFLLCLCCARYNFRACKMLLTMHKIIGWETLIDCDSWRYPYLNA